ncbi:MAG: PorV/PorQ family protein [Balneolales bacterium]|nr:PorV/PorQ family protein [Balneolales bacterium]
MLKCSNIAFYLVLAMVAVLNSSQVAMAQSGGLQLLGIGPEPTSLALAEAVTAREIGSAAIFTNPANLALEPSASATVSHTFWLQNSGNSHASVVLPTSRSSFAFGILTSSITDIEARQTPGDPSGTFDVNYYAFAGSYARNIGPVALGVSAMYLYEQLYQMSASGYGINVGASTILFDNRLRLGSAVLNMGRMDYLAETRSPLPTIWKTGFWADAVQFSVSGSNEIPIMIAISADLNVPLNDDGASDGASVQEDPWVSTGLEATISELLSFRAGIRTGDTKRRFSSGVGVHFDRVQFNYAFVPFETGFGMTHALSLKYYFDI